MRAQLAAVTLLTLLAEQGLSQERPGLSDEADRINYTIGHQIGTDFNKQQVQLDQQALRQGMGDGNGGRQPLLDAEEMNQRLVDLKQSITQDMKDDAMKRMEERKAQIGNKRLEGRKFLEANQTKEGVTTTPSGLQYKVITPGSGPMPKASDQVKIHYRARRLSGQEFNSSFKKGGPSVFPVNGVIPGFTEALTMMRPGAKWEIYLPPELAFGRKGPLGYETVIIEVELLEIVEPGAEQAETASPDTD